MEKRNFDDPKFWGIINAHTPTPLALRPIGLRILILEDPFKSRYECKTCKGKGHTNETCPQCLGKKYIASKLDGEESTCPSCTFRGERNIAYGKVFCPDCNGSGGILIIPDDSKKPPTTGTVLAVGDGVLQFKPGDRVLYSNYTGSKFEMDGCTIRLCMEHEVYCEVRSMSKSSVSEENPAQELSTVGMPT